jgi:hypothetical protein
LSEDSTPDKASPAQLLLNQNLYNWRTTCRVWYLDFHREGVIYKGEWDLHRLGEVSLAPGGDRPTKPCGRSASRVERPPPTLSTDLGFSSSCRHVSTKARAEMPQTLAGRPLCPLSQSTGPLGPRVKYTPVVMIILTFGQLHFVIH